MIPSPCLHPVRVYNKTLRTYHYVPCGHCDACLCIKGFGLSESLSQACTQYAHRYFVTLTFADEYLPVARFDSEVCAYIHPFDADYNGVVYSVDAASVEASLSNKDFADSFNKYGGVPVLSRRLAILFKKRLRKHFAKIYGKEYLFIYICGEYGPSTFRPHYHCVLCTNASVKSDILKECVFKAWSDYTKNTSDVVYPYGRVDFQRIIGKGVHNYVAQYLACHTNLPPCLACGQFRQFYQSSSFVDSRLCRLSDSGLRYQFFACKPSQTQYNLCDNTHADVILPKCLVNRIFPKCYKFSALAFVDRVQLYALYQKFSSFTPTQFADCVINCFYGYGDTTYLLHSVFVDADIKATRTRLIRMYYMSRRVCLNARQLGVSLSDYVSQIDLFWSRYELLKLKNFYDLQEKLLTDSLHPCCLQQIFSMYYDTQDDLKHIDYYLSLFGVPTERYSVDTISQQASFRSLMAKIRLDSTKTKKRNDYFDKRGWKRSSFISKFKPKKSCLRFSQI